MTNIADLRDRLLKPGGRVYPHRLSLYERPVEREGFVEGFCVYFEARFDDEVAFTSSPADTPTSWGTPFLRVSPRRVAPGDSVRLELTADDLAHPSSWSWNWR